MIDGILGAVKSNKNEKDQRSRGALRVYEVKDALSWLIHVKESGDCAMMSSLISPLVLRWGVK